MQWLDELGQVMEDVTCSRCGFSWERVDDGTRAPKLCAECTAFDAQHKPAKLHQRIMGDYNMAAKVTEYRLAIEEAASLLRQGKPGVALNVLRSVDAPMR